MRCQAILSACPKNHSFIGCAGSTGTTIIRISAGNRLFCHQHSDKINDFSLISLLAPDPSTISLTHDLKCRRSSLGTAYQSLRQPRHSPYCSVLMANQQQQALPAYYEILHVVPTASTEEIKNAYKKESLRYTLIVLSQRPRAIQSVLTAPRTEHIQIDSQTPRLNRKRSSPKSFRCVHPESVSVPISEK